MEFIVNSEIFIYQNIEKLAEGFSKILLHDVNKSNDIFKLALSGGSTPKAIFDYLAENYKSKINWKKIHFFWGDERCVPPNHADSNYLMAYKHLFSKIIIPEGNIFSIKGEYNPEVESKRYSEVILKNVPLVNSIPSFDLIMLGLGEDGHTASIFPDRLDLFQSNNICEVVIHPATKQQRITLTGKVINNAKKIVFLVADESKRKVVDKVLNKKECFKTIPASFINPTHGELIWLLDKEAAHFL